MITLEMKVIKKDVFALSFTMKMIMLSLLLQFMHLYFVSAHETEGEHEEVEPVSEEGYSNHNSSSNSNSTEIICVWCDTTMDPECNKAVDTNCSSEGKTPEQNGCIIVEYWDSDNEKVGMEQRCTEDHDFHGRWNIKDQVDSVTARSTKEQSDGKKLKPASVRKVDKPQAGTRQAQELSPNCLYFVNLRTNEKAEKCFCRVNLCNEDMDKAGGIGNPKTFPSGNCKLENSRISLLLMIIMIVGLRHCTLLLIV